MIDFHLLIKINIILVFTAVFLYATSYVLNWLSYRVLKNRIIEKQSWDLNICCGATDGGGINADIIKHSEVDNFVLIQDIYKLPFQEGQFESVLCSHTIEHVDDPKRFHEELMRVGKRVTYIMPPLWDITAAFNFIEHKWLFLTLSKEHSTLPRYIRLPFSSFIQRIFGQRKKA